MSTGNFDVNSQKDRAVKVRFTLDATSVETAKSLEVSRLREAVKRDMEMLSVHKFRSPRPGRE
jgi:hypothetical protein